MAWFRVQFGINKHEEKINKIARARRASAIWGLWKIFAYLSQIIYLQNQNGEIFSFILLV